MTIAQTKAARRRMGNSGRWKKADAAKSAKRELSRREKAQAMQGRTSK